MLSQGLSSLTHPAAQPPAPRHHEAICQAAAEILVESGMAGLSVSAVMARAGVSRTAFYRVFDDIYTVVDAVLRPITAELLAASGDWFRGQTETAITRDQNAGVIDRALNAHGAAQALTWMGEQTSRRLMGRRHAGTPEDYADLLTPIWTRTLFGFPSP